MKKILVILLSIMSTPAYSFSEKEYDCLALNVYFEARGETNYGQRAVADVTLNRVSDARWPNTICGVVYQPYQFSWTASDLKVTQPDVYRNIQLKVRIWANEPRQTVSDHFVRYDVNVGWTRNLVYRARIGDHIFYSSR